jgi:hypothetical protein
MTAMPSESERSPFRFSSVAEQAGIDFVYYGSPSPQHYMTEQNGGGIALFDYDGSTCASGMTWKSVSRFEVRCAKAP